MELERKEGSLKKFYAIDAVDTADLCFIILQSDVNFLKTGSGKTE